MSQRPPVAAPGDAPGAAGDGDGPRPWSAVGKLLAHVTTELSAPLGIVNMAAETLGEMVATGEFDGAGDVVEMLVRNGRLASLQLARFSLASNLDQGLLELAVAPIDLTVLARDLVRDLRPSILRDHPTAVTSSGMVLVWGDESAVREIVFNLLAHAVSQSHEGAAIDIAVDRRNGTGRLSVLDHGMGTLSGHAREFFEGSDEEDTALTGHGLGLSISRGLARALGGELSTEPAATVGHLFRLELPATT